MKPMINVLLVHEKKYMLDMISSALEDDPEIAVKGKLTNIGECHAGSSE